MKFIRDLYYAVATGAIIGTIIGLRRRQSRERREAQARAARVPPVNYHRQRRAYRSRRRIN